MSKKKGPFVFRFSYDIVAKNEGDANMLFQAEIDTINNNMVKREK